MFFRKWKKYYLAAQEETIFPEDSVPVTKPGKPLIFLKEDRSYCARGFYGIRRLAELDEKDELTRLQWLEIEEEKSELADFVQDNGASVLNVAYKNAYAVMETFFNRPKDGLKVTLIGLGDVGGTVLTGLKLLGHEIREVQIYDPYEPLGYRYELEMNQILQVDKKPMPVVTICDSTKFFDADLIIFTASRGVPALGSQVQDVRMAQFDANKEMLDVYALTARQNAYTGMFCQVSDPVDHLAQEVYLRSNVDEQGTFDFGGLLPEQVQGFGLGVMMGRASYFARKRELPTETLRAYGPHGKGLIIANACNDQYDDALSSELTELTREANMAVRDLGFKPYIAPGFSSAAISILRMLRGEEHFSCVLLDGVYFGCLNSQNKHGQYIKREIIHNVLYQRIEKAHHDLKEFWKCREF